MEPAEALMRVVGVSHVLDEADIIEPFIRHHAALLDLHIVLDNGSRDGTVDILRALHAEGLKLQVYQTESPIFLEQLYNTGLYRLALGEGADWVLLLDADELLVVREAARPHSVLSLVPEGIPCLRLQSHNYVRSDVAAGLHPFSALRRRALAPETSKVAIRRLDPARVVVSPGNHFCVLDGAEELGLPQERLRIAHLPDRGRLQMARKAILGRIKKIASGDEAASRFGTHRMAAFDALKTAPRAWLEAEDVPTELADDAVTYLGGELRYTVPQNEVGRLVGLLAAQLEVLARSHGAILDGKRLIKRELLRRGAEVRRVF